MPGNMVSILFLAVLITAPLICLATDVISASTFDVCAGKNSSQVSVDKFAFTFSRETKTMNFEIVGFSSSTTHLTVELLVTAYGIQAFSRTIDPCSAEYSIEDLCPLQIGPFAARGNVVVPERIIAQIPAIAFKVPDLSGIVTMNLVTSAGSDAFCLEAPVGNGQSLDSPTTRSITGSIAAGALLVSGAVSVVASISSAPSSSTLNIPGGHSPNAGEMFLWFQSIALSGALSVKYPDIYKSFTRNFGWATGMVSWLQMQEGIDNFRQRTGGNVTASSIELLSLQASGLSTASSSTQPGNTVNQTKLARRNPIIAPRAEAGTSRGETVVAGLMTFVESLRVPSPNTFLTMFLIFLCGLAGCTVVVFFGKCILEAWHKAGHFPKCLENIRENYSTNISGLAVRFVLVVYGSWCLFCFYEFRNGDSWAATLVAGITLAILSMVILVFTFQITRIAWELQKTGHGITQLYEYTPHLNRYGTFYDQYKSQFWWFFVPCIAYSLMKALFIAFGDGHGLVQIIGCIVCEISLLVFLLITQAYDGRQPNVVNCIICLVRLCSLLGTLVFVDLFGFKETTKTISGIVLIVLQSLLTVALLSLIVFNAITPLFKEKTAEESANTELQVMKTKEPRLSRLSEYDADLSYKSPYLNSRLSYASLANHSTNGEMDNVNLYQVQGNGSSTTLLDKLPTVSGSLTQDRADGSTSKKARYSPLHDSCDQ